MADGVAGDRTLAAPVADPSATSDSCPHCGGLLADRLTPTRNILLKAVVPQHIASALIRTRSLSPRETAVFELLGLGYDNRSLARTLEVSERTAKRHVTAILTKLGLESRLQAGLAAMLTTSLRPAAPRQSTGPKVAWTTGTDGDETRY